VHIDWGNLEVEQAPALCPPVFGGDSLTVFGRVKGGATDKVILHADAHSWEVPIALAQPETGGAIPTLWARHRIRDLEARHGAPVRGSAQADRKADLSFVQLVELGQRYGLLSSATSYVAVEERSAADQTTTPAVLRKVPIAITQGWHGRGSVFPSAMPLMLAGSAAFAARARQRVPTASLAPQIQFRQRQTIQALYSTPTAPSPAMPSQEAIVRERVTPADRLFDLLMTQQADGSFRLSAVLQHWLGSRWQAVKAAAEQHGEGLVATAVVVALLAQEAADRADEWGPAVAKAQRWLAQQGRHVEVEAWL